MLIPLSNEGFIDEEFLGLDLGDERLNKRVLKVGELINGNPSLSFPNASRAVKAELKAFYRFFQNGKTTDQKLLSTHYYNTIQRCLECNDRILLITDSTFVSPAKSKTMDGLKDMGKGKGNMLRIHYMIAVQESNGEVLGITDFRVIGKDLQQTDISLEDESDVWKLVAQATVKRIIDNLGEREGAKLISLCTYVADREGDDFDLFSCLNVLNLNCAIRSQYDRKIEHAEEKQKISALEYEEVKYGDIYEIEVQEKGGSKRVATVQRSVLEECKIFPTDNQSKKKALILNLVIVRETYPPLDKEPVMWRLFTTRSVNKDKDSEQIVIIYKMRWKIEELNKCAKTGVLLENRQFTKAEIFIPAAAMIFVVSWRILYIRDIAKRNDNTLADQVFNKEEVSYLNNKLVPEKGKDLTVKDAIGYIAKEGGFLGHYENPGWIILWRGWFKFVLLVEGHTLGLKIAKNKKRGYG